MKGLSLAIAGLAVVGLAAQAPAPATGAAAPQGRGARRAAPAPPPPAPAPGSAGTYKVDADLMDVLKKSIAAAGQNMATSAVANTDQYSINIVHTV